MDFVFNVKSPKVKRMSSMLYIPAEEVDLLERLRRVGDPIQSTFSACSPRTIYMVGDPEGVPESVFL